MRTRWLPQAAASCAECSGELYGSLSLTTTVLWNENGCVGVSEKPRACAGKLGPLEFGTATNSAALMGECCVVAQCATAKQARLWATNTTSGPVRFTASSIAATHSAHTGLSQSRCWTRTHSGCDCSQIDCQCSGPELPIPGRIRAVANK